MTEYRHPGESRGPEAQALDSGLRRKDVKEASITMRVKASER
jgi:hypothetical protein